MVKDSSKKPEPENVMTSAMLKALANPLRRRAVNTLARLGHARAADLAAELDVPANTLSFHLRVLADAGLVEEAPEFARDRRDRVWKERKQKVLQVGTPAHPMEDDLAGAALVRLIYDEHTELVRRVADWVPEYTQGRDPVERGTFQQRQLRLTRAEFEAVMKRVDKAFTEAEERHDENAADSLFWQIDLVAADDTI